MTKLLSLLAALMLIASVNAQEFGSAEGARYFAEMQNRQIEELAAWNGTKKLTIMANAPKRPSAFVKLDSVTTGWKGDLSAIEFTVLSITSDTEVILSSKSQAIWLVGFKTNELTDSQKVRVVGPLLAGETRSYTTVSGSSRTIRTFSFVDGQELKEFESTMAQQAGLDDVKQAVKTLIWGNTQSVPVSKMDRKQVAKYKSLLDKLKKQATSGQVDETLTTAIELKKSKLLFDSRESKELTIEHLKTLLTEITK